jgi:putative acetyltransferase
MIMSPHRTVQIREERPADIESIFKVHAAAFDTLDEAQLVDLLRSRGKATISLVAEDGDEILGHILFSPVSLDPPAPGWRAFGLAPIGVSPEHQRQGIGKALINSGLEYCKELGSQLVVVLGDPTYYSNFGFKRASDFGLRNEYQADEHFMVLDFFPGVLETFSGLVKFAQEFNEISI